MPSYVPFRTSSYLDESGEYSIRLDAARLAMVDSLNVNFAKQLAAAVRAEGTVESETLRFIGESLAAERLVQAFGSEFTQMHHEIGLAAQRSMIQAYSHRRFRRPSGSYRVGDQRYAGKALLNALRSEGHINAFARGLEFLDGTILDAAAKQWRRLNFGAGGGSVGGIQAPQQFSVEWAGLVVATMGLTGDPRPAFRIPRGFWFGPGGEREGAGQSRTGRFFYVGSPDMPEGRHGRPSPGRVTAGIASSNFLDAATRRIANEIGPGYETLYRDLYERQLPKLTGVGVAAGIGAPGVPAPQVFRRFHRGSQYF